jgi:hypothetical protein
MLDKAILMLQSNVQAVTEAPSARASSVWNDAGWVSVIIGLVFGFATIFLALVAIRQARRRKSLTYEILSTTPLATLHEELEGRVQIVFDGQAVRDVQLVLLKIKNSGNMPILSGDYEDALRLRVATGAKILSASVVETFPQSLEDRAKASVEFNSTRVKVKPLLLNGGDYIKVKILVTQLESTVAVSGRIAGVSDIKEQKPSSSYRFDSPVFNTMITAIVILVLLIVSMYTIYGSFLRIQQLNPPVLKKPVNPPVPKENAHL